MPVLDDLEFAREAGEHFGAQRLVAFARAVETELPQIRKGGFAVRNNTFRENEFAECELQVTAVGDFCCSVQPFRVVGKTLLHFGGGLEPGFGGGDFRWGDGGQQSASANGVYGAMMEILIGLKKVHVVGGDERNAEFAAKAFGFAHGSAVAGREVLDFDKEAVSEDVLQLRKVTGD